MMKQISKINKSKRKKQIKTKERNSHDDVAGEKVEAHCTKGNCSALYMFDVWKHICFEWKWI